MDLSILYICCGNNMVRKAFLIWVMLLGFRLGLGQDGKPAVNEPLTAEDELVKELEKAVQKGGYDEGLAMLREKVGKQPMNIAARFFLATAYQAKGKRSECIQEVRAAEKLKIIDDRLLGILWVCLYEDGRKAEALKTASQAVARFPDSGESHRWYGISLLDENKDTEATSHFQKAIILDPRDATSLYMLAQSYRSRGYIVPSFLTYLRFFSVEPEGNRANKARSQLRDLLSSKLIMQFEDRSRVEMHLSVGPDGPMDEGDYRKAQQMMAVYAAPNAQERNLTPAKLEKVLNEVLKALPDKSSVPQGSFILEVMAPFFVAARDAGFSRGLTDLVLMDNEPSPSTIAFLEWSLKYDWTKK